MSGSAKFAKKKDYNFKFMINLKWILKTLRR